jgi:preprotein translocase subunit SecD
MSRRLALALVAMLAAAGMQACAAEPAAPPARSYETGKLMIGGESFTPAEVIDARAIPDINKKVGLMLSLSPAAAERLERITAALIGKPMLVALDGKTLGAELVRKPIVGGVIELPGRWTLSEAEALARRISGKDPLPDDLGGE